MDLAALLYCARGCTPYVCRRLCNNATARISYANAIALHFHDIAVRQRFVFARTPLAGAHSDGVDNRNVRIGSRRACAVWL